MEAKYTRSTMVIFKAETLVVEMEQEDIRFMAEHLSMRTFREGIRMQDFFLWAIQEEIATLVSLSLPLKLVLIWMTKM